MRVRCLIIVIMVLIVSHLGVTKAEAFVFISEFFADPALGLDGDANNDGVRDTYDDEFVEIYNSGTEKVDISGWKLYDVDEERHKFDSGIEILPNEIIVVFGGGSPNIESGRSFTSLAGYLRLNNGGDTIVLTDAGDQIVDSYTYGPEAGDDQSMVRNPEGSKGEWIKHTTLPNANGRLFSPGYFVNEIDPPAQSTVPEPVTILSLSFGLGTIFLMRKKQ